MTALLSLCIQLIRSEGDGMGTNGVQSFDIRACAVSFPGQPWVHKAQPCCNSCTLVALFYFSRHIDWRSKLDAGLLLRRGDSLHASPAGMRHFHGLLSRGTQALDERCRPRVRPLLAGPLLLATVVCKMVNVPTSTGASALMAGVLSPSPPFGG